jgi:hypothetical protein
MALPSPPLQGFVGRVQASVSFSLLRSSSRRALSSRIPRLQSPGSAVDGVLQIVESRAFFHQFVSSTLQLSIPARWRATVPRRRKGASSAVWPP